MRDARQRTIMVGIVLLTGMIAGAVVSSARPEAPYDPVALSAIAELNAEVVDRPAIPFALPDLEGRVRTLGEFEGKLVFLNFWATWCPPCREELPSMLRLARRMSTRPFVMVAVSIDEDEEALRRFVATHELGGGDLVILHDSSGTLSRQYGTLLLPETYLIDERGRTIARFQNAYDWERPTVRQLLERLIRQSWRDG